MDCSFQTISGRADSTGLDELFGSGFWIGDWIGLASSSSWVIKLSTSWAELWVQARGRWAGMALRSASEREQEQATVMTRIFSPREWKWKWKWLLYLSYIKKNCSGFTLKELSTACSGSSSRHGQPHDSVGPLLCSPQSFPHHLVELRHWFRNSWKQDWKTSIAIFLN